MMRSTLSLAALLLFGTTSLVACAATADGDDIDSNEAEIGCRRNSIGCKSDTETKVLKYWVPEGEFSLTPTSISVSRFTPSPEYGEKLAIFEMQSTQVDHGYVFNGQTGTNAYLFWRAPSSHHFSVDVPGRVSLDLERPELVFTPKNAIADAVRAANDAGKPITMDFGVRMRREYINGVYKKGVLTHCTHDLTFRIGVTAIEGIPIPAADETAYYVREGVRTFDENISPRACAAMIE